MANNMHFTLVFGMLMVDTISIQQQHVRPPRWLSSARETIDRETGEVKWQEGSCEGIRLWYHPAGLLRARGSLPFYLQGSNVETLTRAEIQEAALHLSSRFGFDPSLARVYQLDVGATLTMPRPVAEYLSVLATARRFKRVEIAGETVSYRNTLRWLNFYDKAKAKKAGSVGHLLRFEIKYLQKVKGRFQRALVLSDLYGADFFPVLVDHWLAAYRLVRKVQRPVLIPVPTPRQLEREFARIGLHAYGGETAACAAVEAWSFDPKRKGNLKKKIRELADMSASTRDAELIEELDSAIEQAVALALQT